MKRREVKEEDGGKRSQRKPYSTGTYQKHALL